MTRERTPPIGSRGGITWSAAVGWPIGDYDDAKALTAFLQPCMDLMGFEVRAITENGYARRIDELR